MAPVDDSISYRLRARGSVLRCLNLAYFGVFVVAIYVYFTIGFKLWLLISYFTTLLVFYSWGYSVKLDISHEGINWKQGLARKIFLKWEDISEITMGRDDVLIFYSKNSDQKAIKINYFLLFNKRELAKVLKTIFYINPNIVVDSKAKAFIKRDGASALSEILFKK
jgi:hypothetical protein